MSNIPFSVYDVFGYLAAGLIVLAAGDYAFAHRWLIQDDLILIEIVFWLIAAYITGHVVANMAGHAIEEWLVRRRLGSPEVILFQVTEPKRLQRLFPGYHRSFPTETQQRVLDRAKADGIDTPGRALFYHCFELVKHDQATRERLSSFLNLYGFARNVSFALLLAAMLLVIGMITDSRRTGGVGQHAEIAAIAAVIGSIGMFYRYLKFYREYTIEVIRSCAGKDKKEAR